MSAKAHRVAHRNTKARRSIGGVRFSSVADPIVSIVIPVYNHVADTVACLRAVQLNTTLNSFEVIVCDDASSDGTSEVLHAITGLK